MRMGFRRERIIPRLPPAVDDNLLHLLILGLDVAHREDRDEYGDHNDCRLDLLLR